MSPVTSVILVLNSHESNIRTTYQKKVTFVYIKASCALYHTQTISTPKPNNFKYLAVTLNPKMIAREMSCQIILPTLHTFQVCNFLCTPSEYFLGVKDCQLKFHTIPLLNQLLCSTEYAPIGK